MTTDAPANSANDRSSALNGRRKLEYPFLFRWLHWLLTGSLVVLVLTGFSLHAGARPDWSLLDGKVPGWFWTGRVHLWHSWAALVFTPAILAACWVYLFKRVFVRPTHIILLVSGLLTVISGFFLANPPESGLLYHGSLWVHAVVGLAIIPIWLLWHAITGLTRYKRMLVPAFDFVSNDRLWPIVGLLVLAVPTSCVLMYGWPFTPPWRELAAARIDTVEVSDLVALPWDKAQALKVPLVNGSSFDAGRTLLVLRALHNGDELFVQAQWDDDDENYEYWPWRKTEDGWEYLQTSAKDECKCYEDKFSLVFPVQPDGDFERFGCAVSCHLHGDYGWGYKGYDRLLDVWHWKAARTDPAGQVDDKYWSVVDFDNKDIGRHGDPKEGGGYTKNRKEEIDHPLFLPDSPDAVVQGSFPKDRAVEYTDEAGAAIAPETIVPGVVTDAFVGDRGDVTCRSRYEDGRWTLYIRRKLETGSPYDAQFLPGKRVAFGCAAFDHAGKRHAHALPTFYLKLAE